MSAEDDPVSPGMEADSKDIPPAEEVPFRSGRGANLWRRFLLLRVPPPSPDASGFELAVKMGVSASAGFGICYGIHLRYPQYVFLAVAMCVHCKGKDSLSLSLARSIGSVIGIFSCLAIVGAWGVHPWSVGIAFFLIALLCSLPPLVITRRISLLIFSVGAFGFANQVPSWTVGRLWATAIGCAVSFAVSAAPWPERAEARIRSVLRRSIRIPWHHGTHADHFHPEFKVGQE